MFFIFSEVTRSRATRPLSETVERALQRALMAPGQRQWGSCVNTILQTSVALFTPSQNVCENFSGRIRED